LVTALDVVGSLDKDISESVVSSKISTPAPALSTVKKKNDSPPPLPAAAFFDDELVGIEEGNHVIPQPPIKTPKGNSIDALVAERDELNKSSGSSI